MQRVLPDGCADIIFNFGEAVTRKRTGESSLPRESVTAVGMMTTFQDVLNSSHTDLLGMRFKGGALSRITEAPLNELKNLTVPAHEIVPEIDAALLERLAICVDSKARIAGIEHMLTRLLSRCDVPWDRQVSSVTDLIIQSQGKISMRALAGSTCISLRQLQRRFKARVGIGIKEYARIVRFRHATKVIQSSPGQSLLHTAFECGYYDHAHLNNDFKAIAGTLPSELR